MIYKLTVGFQEGGQHSMSRTGQSRVGTHLIIAFNVSPIVKLACFQRAPLLSLSSWLDVPSTCGHAVLTVLVLPAVFTASVDLQGHQYSAAC